MLQGPSEHNAIGVLLPSCLTKLFELAQYSMVSQTFLMINVVDPRDAWYIAPALLRRSVSGEGKTG